LHINGSRQSDRPMKPPLYLWEFGGDLTLLETLDCFWVRERDFVVIDPADESAIQKVKATAQAGTTVTVAWRMNEQPALAGAEGILEKTAISLSNYEAQNVFFFLILVGTEIEQSRGTLNRLLDLMKTYPFVRGIAVFSDKTFQGYIGENDVLENTVGFLKVLMHANVSRLVEGGFFKRPVAIRVRCVSVPYQGELHEATGRCIVESFGSMEVDDLTVESIRRESESLLNKVLGSVRTAVKDSLPALGNISRELENVFVSAPEKFNSMTVPIHGTSLRSAFEELRQKTTSMQAILPSVSAAEGRMGSVAGLKTFYDTFLFFLDRQLEALGKGLRTVQETEIHAHEKTQSLVTQHLSESEPYRKRISSSWKVLLITLLALLCIAAIDATFLRLTLWQRLTYAGIFVLSCGIMGYASYFAPKAALRRLYHAFLREAYILDDRIFETVLNCFSQDMLMNTKGLVEKRKERLQVLLDSVKEVMNSEPFKQAGLKDVITIKDMLLLTPDELRMTQHKITKSVLSSISDATFDLKEAIGRISLSIREDLEAKAQELPNFWGKSYEEVKHMVNERYQSINCEACIPFLMGFVPKIFKFFIAQPSNCGDFLYRAGGETIELDTNRDIIFGIWGHLLEREEPDVTDSVPPAGVTVKPD
jgi:hypothetical protein